MAPKRKDRPEESVERPTSDEPDPAAEEYTGYRRQHPGREGPGNEEEAEREAELQPGAAEEADEAGRDGGE